MIDIDQARDLAAGRRDFPDLDQAFRDPPRKGCGDAGAFQFELGAHDGGAGLAQILLGQVAGQLHLAQAIGRHGAIGGQALIAAGFGRLIAGIGGGPGQAGAGLLELDAGLAIVQLGDQGAGGDLVAGLGNEGDAAGDFRSDAGIIARDDAGRGHHRARHVLFDDLAEADNRRRRSTLGPALGPDRRSQGESGEKGGSKRAEHGWGFHGSTRQGQAGPVRTGVPDGLRRDAGGRE